MKSVVVVIAIVASVALASNAYAIGIYGGIDTGTGINTSTCGNLPQCEEATLAAFLGLSVNDVTLTQVTTGASDWVSIEDYIPGTNQVDSSTNLMAFDFKAHGITDPLAFILKVGGSSFDFYLFTNSNSLQYALIDLNKLQKNSGNVTVSSLSHIATVPEAGSLSLLLSGLTALGFVSLRRFRFLK